MTMHYIEECIEYLKGSSTADRLTPRAQALGENEYVPLSSSEQLDMEEKIKDRLTELSRIIVEEERKRVTLTCNNGSEPRREETAGRRGLSDLLGCGVGAITTWACNAC